MNKIILLTLIMLLASCAKVTEVKVPLCKYPYFEYKAGECCLDNNSNDACDVDEKTPEIKPIEETETKTTETKEKEEEITALKKGESSFVYGKEIKLTEFEILDNRLNIELLIDSQTSFFKQTKKPEINNGLEIQVDAVDQLKNTAVFRIKRFELKNNEYILYVNKPINIKGYDIILEDVDIRDNTAVYSIKQAGNLIKDGRLRLGYSIEVENLKITNIKTFFHDQRANRYGLFRIE